MFSWTRTEGVMTDAFLIADMGSSDRWGNTPLHLAADSGHVDVIKVLLDAGANVSASSVVFHRKFLDEKVVELGSSNTPLHLATQNGHAEAVSILLHAGADVSSRGIRVEFYEPIYQNVVIHGSTAIHLAAAIGDANIVKILLDAGAEVWAEDCHYDTPLQLAVQLSHRKVVQVLLDAGADVNQSVGNRCPRLLPLCVAIENRDPETVRILLDAGADTKFDNVTRSETPLILAVESVVEATFSQTPEAREAAAKAILVIRALLEGGADPGGSVPERSYSGHCKTPLHEAVTYGCEEVVAILLDAGADERGCTHFLGPWGAIALEQEYPAIMALLLDAAAARKARCVAFAMGHGKPSKPEA